MTKDTASFSGISCQKAAANFENKNWIAWFTPSLPFSSGLNKLNGLPGLIIETYDEDKEITYRFGGMLILLI